MHFDFHTWLEQLCRGNSDQRSIGASHYAEFADVLSDDIFLPEQETQLLTLSSYWDGHVREAAVRKLRHAHSPDALRAIIERLNDWVPQVRSAAVEAAVTFISGNDIAHTLPCLDAILALSRKQRADHTSFIALIDRLLSRPETHATVKAFFNASRGAVARHVFTQMLSWQSVELNKTIATGARHPDLTVRMAALKACGQLDETKSSPILKLFLEDKQPAIRKEALRAMWSRNDSLNTRTGLLQRFLVDSSTSVRELALWYAKQIEFDVDGYLQFYMQSFPRHDANDQGALGLIGMVSAQHYLPLVQSSFKNGRPVVRRAALVAWVQINKETAAEAVAEALLETGKVSKTAKQLLSKGRVDLSAEQFIYIVETALNRQQFDKALGFISQLPLWERFEYLLRCLANASDNAERIKIVSALQEWELAQNRSYLKPDSAQNQRLKAMLNDDNRLAALLKNTRLWFALEQIGLLDKT